ncbi:unnamed protein product [Ectocarpus sp. CCAP 1310/34]|nr:unnamed protein product [Ectocarpus sp. CCAP 1310/34]
MFVTVPSKAFVETLGFVLLVLMNARFYGLAERCLSTAVAFAKTRRYADNAKAIRHKAWARGLTKKLLVKSRLARVTAILDVQSR